MMGGGRSLSTMDVCCLFRGATSRSSTSTLGSHRRFIGDFHRSQNCDVL